MAIALVSMTAFIATGTTVLAKDNIETGKSVSTTHSYTLLDNVENVVDGGKVYINGESNQLYRVFDDESAALQNIKNKVPNLLKVLEKEYNLLELSDENWEQYRDSMYMLFDSKNKPKDYDESNIEFRTLRSFFDIYENSDKNKEIIKRVSDLKGVPLNMKEMKMDEISTMLPYTEPAAKEFISSHANSAVMSASASYDIQKAVNYANKYAKSPNKASYHYFRNGDCANFTSQILENAGVKQIVYDNVAKGWWHKVTSVLGIKRHKHSQSWSMADTFARYQGIMYSTTSNSKFNSNISKGSLIVADFNNDGD